MKNTINHKYTVMALTILLVFGVLGAFPVDAHADYYNPYGTPIRNQYGYGYNDPVYVVPAPVIVQQPVYVQQPVIIQQPVVYYSPLVVSCSANASYSTNGNVTWTAYVSGGNGYYNNYSFSWSGTDGLYGSGQSVYFNYNRPGVKYATVTVYSNGQYVTQGCNTVEVSYPYYNAYPVYQPVVVQQPVVYQTSYAVQNYDLDIGCFVDPTNAKVNQPVTWNAEVTGGVGPYRYSWSGSEGLSGAASSVIKFYDTPGTKSAIVTVTSADGRTGTRACSSALTVASAYKAPAKAVVKATPAPTVQAQATSAAEASNVAAVSLFSLSNVPWGWVAVLVILVLFFTVLYLLFNRTKI